MIDPRGSFEYSGPASDEIKPLRAIGHYNADRSSEVVDMNSRHMQSTRELLLLWGLLKSESARAQVLAIARSEVASRLG